jgi:hypothetical protein
MIHYHKCHNDTRLKNVCSVWDIVKFAINQTRNPTLLSRMSHEGGACENI